MSERLGTALKITVIAAIAIVVLAAGRSPVGHSAYIPDDAKEPILSGNVELTKWGQIPGEGSNPSISFADPLADLRRMRNIKVNQDHSNRFADETDIAVNPINPRNILGGANDYRTGPGYTGFYSSMDGGKHWYDGILPLPSLNSSGSIPDGAGDPIFMFGPDGTAYGMGLGFNRADSISGIFMNRSTNGGRTWSRPVANIFSTTDGCVQFYSSTTPGYLHDKPDATIDWSASSPYYGRIYVSWTKFTYTSGGSYVESPIYVAYSDDQAVHWSSGSRVSTTSGYCDGGNCYANQGSSIQTGADGTVYLINHNANTPTINQILFQKSTDGGNTWSAPVKIDDVYDYGYLPYNSDSRYTLSNAKFRINCYPQLAINKSTGRLYCTWADDRNGSSSATNMDVFLKYSDDGGASWSSLMTVNTDSSATDQWWPAIAVTPKGGVGIMFYDRRDTGNTNFNAYFAYSKTGVGGWTNTKISTASSDPYKVFGTTNSFIGDYNGIAYGGGVFYPFWTDARHGTSDWGRTDVYTTPITVK